MPLYLLWFARKAVHRVLDCVLVSFDALTTNAPLTIATYIIVNILSFLAGAAAFNNMKRSVSFRVAYIRKLSRQAYLRHHRDMDIMLTGLRRLGCCSDEGTIATNM